MTHPDYTTCAMCKTRFGEGEEPSLIEDGVAYCDSCTYEINQFQGATAA